MVHIPISVHHIPTNKMLSVQSHKSVDVDFLNVISKNTFRCTTLQELVLTDNFLTELPSSIGNLTKLTNLNVDRNRLEYIPREIGNLVNLGKIQEPY